MEILLEPTSNKLMVERFFTSAGNPVKEILLKLNLPDHRILKDGGEDFRYSDTERLSRSDEVLKVKNFKKDATLKLSKSTNQEWRFCDKVKVTKGKRFESGYPNPPLKNKTDNLEQLVGVPKPSVVDVNNPTVGSTKGQKTLRIKGGKEKSIEKSLKAGISSLCGEEVYSSKRSVQKEVVQEKVDLAEDEEELSEEDEGLIHE
ncbi:hypothetical protein Tco_0123715 [Tanacetum coccineum]